MWVSVTACALALAVLLFGLAGCVTAMRYLPEDEKLQGSAKCLYLGYLIGVLRRRMSRRLRIDDSEEAYFREMYINDRPGAKRTADDCLFGMTVLGITAVLATSLFLAARAGIFSESRLRQIDRPDSGTGVAKLRAVYGDETYDLSLAVAEKQMTPEEIRKSAAEAEETMLAAILGENESADEVTKPLTLLSEVPGTPISVSWNTSDYRVIDYAGNVHPEAIEGQSEIVILTAVLSYGEWEESMQLPLRVVSASGDESGRAKEIEELLLESAREQAYRETIDLPGNFGGEKIEFYEEQRSYPGIFILYAVVLGIVLFLWSVSRKKQNRKNRERQLLRDYPEVVSKLSLLLEAGSTIRLAWERVVNDYLRKRDSRPSHRRYAYEEMLHTRNRMSMGIPEETAYEEFGRRCGNIRYLRLASVIVQNLKKGSAGILPLLQKEAEEAFCDRREQAKQKGEEAGTKLLLPMAGILVIILAMILIPAFTAM
ncbi:MAG: hypothetical protein IJM57_05510 [Lachnospiraceae bacterium]|nr:hypothetical protein [Lachnospiraceae bacterium]